MAKEKSKDKTKKEKKAKYEVFLEEYKGTEVIAIYEVDSDGDKVRNFPLVSMGRKKWEVVLANRNKVKELLG